MGFCEGHVARSALTLTRSGFRDQFNIFEGSWGCGCVI